MIGRAFFVSAPVSGTSSGTEAIEPPVLQAVGRMDSIS